jgi:hypothetical protein
MSNNQDIIEMLDTLKLPTASQRFQELLKSPDLGNYDQVQFCGNC